MYKEENLLGDYYVLEMEDEISVLESDIGDQVIYSFASCEDKLMARAYPQSISQEEAALTPISDDDYWNKDVTPSNVAQRTNLIEFMQQLGFIEEYRNRQGLIYEHFSLKWRFVIYTDCTSIQYFGLQQKREEGWTTIIRRKYLIGNFRELMETTAHIINGDPVGMDYESRGERKPITEREHAHEMFKDLRSDNGVTLDLIFANSKIKNDIEEMADHYNIDYP